jgi:hypothetical protein
VFAKERANEAERRRNGRAFVRLDPDLRAAYRFNSGLTEAGNFVIRDYRSWHRLWDRMVAPHGPRPPSPGVDFSRDMILVAAMGARPTGGYRIQIISVHERPAELLATVVRTSPGRRCGTIQAVTEPVDIVRMASSPKPVRWVFRDRATPCP